MPLAIEKLRILTFPQRIDGATLDLRVLVLPTERLLNTLAPFPSQQNPGTTVQLPSFLSAELALEVQAIRGLAGYPFSDPTVLAAHGATLEPFPTDAAFPPGLPALFEGLKSQFTVVPAGQGAPAAAVTAPIAQFANGVRLLSADVQPTAAGDLDVETVWDTVEPVPGRDVTAFFQVLEGDRLVVTDDAPLGSGLFPTPRWRVGDQVVERRRLVVPGGFDRNRHRLVTGLYVAPDTTPIAVVGPSDRAPADRVELVPGVGR